MTDSEYKKEIDDLFIRFPSFQKAGGEAYKPGIENMLELDKALGSPSAKFRSVHIAGTNGKGSVSHFIASALMAYGGSVVNGSAIGSADVGGVGCSAVGGGGLKVGLYTSPHLVDFRERIKVNGEMVPREWVYEFLQKRRALFEERSASFFEITTAMAFCYFAECKVDIAVIECGLGGRLDSTNILEKPLVSIITNIGLDHCQYLGNTLQEIAMEKCGIIKRGVPVIVGERGFNDSGRCDGLGGCDDSVGQVFDNEALRQGSPLFFAERLNRYAPASCGGSDVGSGSTPATASGGSFKSLSALATCIYAAVDTSKMDLKGCYQSKNLKTASLALALIVSSLAAEKERDISDNELGSIVYGIENAASLTGLRGRWEKLSDKPLIICDIGHNPPGLAETMPQVEKTASEVSGRFYMVFGVMRDKDLDSELKLLPHSAYYLYVNASSPRALPAPQLAQRMAAAGFNGEVVCNTAPESSASGNMAPNSVAMALDALRRRLLPNDFVFIGGSSYVVAEALPYFTPQS